MPEYAKAEGSDIQQFASFKTEALLLIEGGETAKRLPSETSAWSAQISKELNQLLSNPGIIRNRAKILATINNAQRFLKVQNEFGTFDTYIWRFVNGKPIVNEINNLSDISVFA